jgi:hypothetical protein
MIYLAMKKGFADNKLVAFLLRHEGFVLLICFLVLLRIPNLFEPYWYGDEGIYLTIGTAMRQGLRLYAEIIDHKTPLIYYLAMTPTQFWFRMLLIVWMSFSTFFFFQIAKILKFTPIKQYVASLLFIIFTTVPWLEGNIPNGELFVIGFSLAGAYFFAKSHYFQLFLDGKIIPIKSILSKKETQKLSVAGFFFGLAILTKVPALFDVLPFFLVGAFTLIDHFSIRRSRKVLFSMFSLWEILGISMMFPILLSVLYFALRGSLHDYLNFGLLYNFKYAGTWALPVLPFGLSFFLTMAGKLVLFAIVLIILSLLNKKLSSKTQFLVIWASSVLFGSLLSSRPYPHYLLQLVPAFSLLIVDLLSRKKAILERAVLFLPVLIMAGAVIAIQFGFYSTGKYYTNFSKYLTKQISKEEYYRRFDPLMPDNYKAAALLSTSSEPYIYIWGTNPTLYALAQKIPTGRLTTAFHVPEFEGGFEETYQDLVDKNPEYVVVMKSESIKFPDFFTYLHLNYMPYQELEHMTIYKKISLQY